MNLDLVVLALCIGGFSVLVGVAVRLVLRDRTARAAASDDAIARFMNRGLRLRSGAHVRQLRAGLPDALDMIANSLTAGLTLPQAMYRNLEHFPPAVGEEFARILYDTRLGFSVGGAFDNFAARVPTADVRMIAVASKIGVSHGGKLHENYRMLSSILRDNMSFERELHAMTTEGRMQAIVMSCLPVALMMILGVVNPDMMRPLFTTVLGWVTLGGLFLMQAGAYVWIRKIVSIEV